MFRESSVKFNNKKGFTLAELLGTLAITVILLAIGMVAILHYSNVLKLTEMDNNSKEIFIAAQNHLTHAQASGALKSYDIANNADGRLGTAMTNEPSDFQEATGKTWPENGKDADNAYYYIVYKPGDTSTRNDTILKDILPFGSIDENLRTDGYYIIEYNIRTATVYGVFYNDSKTLSVNDEGAGSYLNSTAAGSKVRADSDSGQSARMGYKSATGDDFVLGYYGGAMVNVLGTKITAPTIQVSNGNKLQVKVTDPNYFRSGGGTQLKTYINLTVTGLQSGSTKTLTLDLTSSGDKGAKTNDNKIYYDSWSVKSDDGNTAKEYTINLDDITRDGGHFAEMFTSFIPGEDITVKATCSSNNVLTQVISSDSIKTNSLFESVTPDMNGLTTYAGTATADVTCIRHIENLDKNVSGLPMAKNTAPAVTTADTTKNQYIITAVNQSKNIDYKDFTDKVEDSSNAFKIYKCGTSNSLATTSYYGIYNYNLETYTGNKKTISNIVIDNKTESETPMGDSNGALFRLVSLNFEISDITLKDFDVYSYKNAAALIAEINKDSNGHTAGDVTVKNVLVDGGTFESTMNKGNAGGFIGYGKASNGTINVTDCSTSPDSVKTENGDAGGFIGEIGSTANITNCYSSGRTTNGEYSKDDYNVTGATSIENSDNQVPAAGGFMGKIGNAKNVDIENCYSTCSVKGYHTGGFIGYDGYNNGGNKYLVDCYATGLVSGANDKTGTFVGTSQKTEFDDCYYLKGINSDSLGWIANNNNAEGTVSGISGDDVSSGNIGSKTTASESYPEDGTLTTDPYRMVNKTGAVNTDNYAHYGDWPVAEKNIIGTNLMAYREGNSTDGYQWYVKGATVKDGVVVVDTVYDSLIKTHNKGDYISDSTETPVYGVLSKTNKRPDGVYGFIGAGEQVKIGKETYYFFRCNRNGLVSTRRWYLDTDRKYSVNYNFNTYFGAAISTSQYDLGTSVCPYQVRTEAQLNNIDYSSYVGKYYTQTCDISLSTRYTGAVIDRTFTGTYDATYTGDEGYNITGLAITVDSGSYCGLFVSNSGTINGVTLTNADMRINKTINNIGLIAGLNNGTMKNCSTDSENNRIIVDVSMAYGSQYLDTASSGNQYEYISMNVGSMVGQVYEDGVLTNCKSGGSIVCYGRNRYGDINVGGLAGLVTQENQNEPDITKCASNTDIKTYYETTYNTTAHMNVGGFAGYLLGCNIYDSKAEGTMDCRYAETNLGGFIGKAATYFNYGYGNSYYPLISGSFSKMDILYMDIQSTSNIGGFIGEATRTIDTDDKWICTNCYASTYFDSTSRSDAIPALFIKENHENTRFHYSHAVERDADGTIVSKNCFDGHHDIAQNSSLQNYALAAPPWNDDIVYIKSAEEYKLPTTFTGFDFDNIWEIKDGASYPTLQDNPE